MKIMLDVEELARKIKERGASSVLLQLPEGLRHRAVWLVDDLERRGIRAMAWMEPTYGACDIVPDVAEMVGADLLVHVGHEKFYKPLKDGNVLYFPIYFDDVREFDFSSLPEKIAVCYSVNYRKAGKHAISQLESQGKKAIDAGAVLGCWAPGVSAAAKEADAVLFVGSGNFHALAYHLMSFPDIPLYVADMERGLVRKVDTSEWERKRYARLFNVSRAEKIGIIVSTKKGQMEFELARRIKERLEKAGKKAYILVLNHISAEKLSHLGLDGFVNTACPRVLDDGYMNMINAGEVGEMLSIGGGSDEDN